MGKNHARISRMPDMTIWTGGDNLVSFNLSDNMRIIPTQCSDCPESVRYSRQKQSKSEQVQHIRSCPYGIEPQCGKKSQRLPHRINFTTSEIMSFITFFHLFFRYRGFENNPQQIRADKHYIAVEVKILPYILMSESDE